MQIHELNNYNGNLDGGAYMPVDNGEDTGKVSVDRLLSKTQIDIAQLDETLNARIDNIIAGGTAPSAAEVTDARLGADGVTYASLGTAIRTQFINANGERQNGWKLALDGDSFIGFVPFSIGSIYNGNYTANIKYRVVSKAKISFSDYTILTAKPGYLFSTWTGDPGSFVSVSGWVSSLSVAPGYEFNVVIRRETEDASEVLTSTVEFESAVTYMLPSALLAKQNKIDIRKIVNGYITPEWGWKRGIIANGAFNVNNTYTVTTVSTITLSKSVTLKIESGFKVRVAYFNPSGDTGWLTDEVTILANRQFLAMIRKDPEDISEVITDITEYTNAVSIPIEETISGNSIINNNKEVPLLTKQALRPLNITANQYQTEPKPLVLFHFSDIHGDQAALERLIEFYEEYKTLFDDAICTGDLKAANTSSSMDFWNNVNGAEDVLISIGNHDATNADSTLQAEAGQYTAMLAPYIDNWGVTYTSGKTYYYKDYAGSKVRLIVVNNMLSEAENAAQLSWFETTLAGAKSLGYTAIVATHFPNGKSAASAIDCNFTDIDITGNSAQFLNGYYELVVRDFIAAGGKFACYFGGHVHKDIIRKGDDHPTQLGVFIDAASIYQSMVYSDIHRQSDDRTADLANVFVIDTSSSTVKIIRVGADRNRYLVSRKTIAINYDTLEILSQS